MRNIILILAINIFCCATNAQSVDTVKVKVHDHIMTLYSSGNGKPTVILEETGKISDPYGDAGELEAAAHLYDLSEK